MRMSSFQIRIRTTRTCAARRPFTRYVCTAVRHESARTDADCFDVARQPNRHLAFGHGIHYCPGAPLARLEGQIAIRMLLERFRTIELASSDLQWRRGLVLRGLQSFPVHLTP